MKYLLFFILFACNRYKIAAQLTISPVFGDKPIAEDHWYVSKNGDSVRFDNIRFYISNIQFETVNNQIFRDTVKAHLIDVFKPSTLKIAISDIDFKEIKRCRFDIGIDSLTNISGALGGDLDPQLGMYWAWQSGYINMKIEGTSPQCMSRKNVFQYHIGGYISPFYALKSVVLLMNAQNIDRKNAFNILNTEGVVLKMDMSKFFENIRISTQNSIMIPCKEALQLADYSVSLFSIQTHEK